MLTEHTITKLYFTPRELAKALGVHTSALRFWEKELDLIVHRSHKNNKRTYTVQECGKFALLTRLVKYYHLSAIKILIEHGDAERALELFEHPMTESVGVPMKIA